MTRNLAIVCVDDESVVLQGLSSQLERSFGKDYNIEMAQTGDEALKLINELVEKEIEVAVLITDQIMPGMKGSELLKQSKEVCPLALNILLTGQANGSDVGEAVNEGNLYRYISKPWESDDLILTVKEAIRSYEKDLRLEEQNEQLENVNKSLEETVAIRTEQLAQEKIKVDELLRNILPAKVAQELIETGTTKPARYDEVTILFSDFIGFTNITSTIPVKKLVNELNDIFSTFDEIMEDEGVEKIQTIGDGYLAVCGLPEEVPDHAQRCVNAAKKMIEYLSERNNRAAVKWNIRVGLHSGPIVAGVVGKKKFAYNLFGDTINVASRIETTGQGGKINISAYTYDLIKEDFSCEYRGKINAKGKGDLDMYFVR